MDIELLTIAQVLKILHVSRTTLYRHLQTGKLKYLKVGRRVLFEKAAVEAWLKSKRVK
jgi:excisionase family DNA binding protein